MNIRIISLCLLLSLVSISVNAQTDSVESFEAKFINWYNKDFSSDLVMGTSVNKVYNELLKDDTVQRAPIIVAVIDGGVDINHKDLKSKIWLNTDEIAGNGIDDDKNGYVDDLHGWNFIGNPSGENVEYENLEYTRIIKKGDKAVPNYSKAKSMYDDKVEKTNGELNMILKFTEVYQQAQTIIYTETGVLVETQADLAEVNSTTDQVMWAKKFLKDRFSDGFTPAGLEEYQTHITEQIDYYLNLNFDPRSLVGDDPTDINDQYYGNADVAGPDPSHGTSVAGVIAAVRDNGIGIDGIASNVKIMVLRSTPNGDERDKDVALSIRYAVDNGARIINMSFGKDFSPQKQFVDEAVKYAASKGVLLVHAAGNSGENIDIENNFPSRHYLEGQAATNWLSVGASSLLIDKEIAAEFSNYGQKNVDIFAPGVNIVSTDKSNAYSLNDGTSLAAPVVSGIAALILEQHPDLSPEELIEIITMSAQQIKKPRKVYIPSLNSDKRKKAKFTSFSKSGGVINAYDALIEANKRKDAEAK